MLNVKTLLTNQTIPNMTTNHLPSVALFHFNDVYNIEPGNHEPVGGAARLATGLKDVRDKEPLVLFSGDCLNPSMISAVERGSQMIPVLNELQVDCAVLGNHEFDFGVEVLENFMSKCRFPWLLSNVLDKCTGKPLANAHQYHIIRKNGIQIGFIGLVEEDWLVTLPTLDLTDMIFTDFVISAREYTHQLTLKGCDIIIALTHMGMRNDLLLAEEVPEIDLILGGHDHHYEIACVNGRYVVKSGSDFQNATVIELSLDKNHKLHRVDMQKLTFDSRVKEDESMKRIVDGYLDNFDEMSKSTLGYFDCDLDGLFTSVRTRETNLGNLMADIMVAATHADVAIINSGTLRSNCTHPKGAFTSKDLIRILPLFDQLCVLDVTGETLLQALENGVSRYPKLDGRFPQVSGIEFAFNPSAPRENRINPLCVKVNGQALNLKKHYRLSVKEYVSRGRDGYSMLKGCPMLVPPKAGPILSTSVRNYFEGIVKPCNNHCILGKCNESQDLARQSSHHNRPDDSVKIIPKVQGRILIVGDSNCRDRHSNSKTSMISPITSPITSSRSLPMSNET